MVEALCCVIAAVAMELNPADVLERSHKNLASIRSIDCSFELNQYPEQIQRFRASGNSTRYDAMAPMTGKYLSVVYAFDGE